jgi:hypothetical protein
MADSLYEVRLAHVPNPDIRGGWNPGYWGDVPELEEEWVEVDSLTDASETVQDWIGEWDLGGGNWIGGDVRQDGVLVAKVKYSGAIQKLS